MTKMAAMPIHDEKTLKKSLDWPWPILRQGQILSLRVLTGKSRNGAFSDAIIVYDMDNQSTSTSMNAKGQGHLVMLAKGPLGQIFSTSLS